MSPRVGEHSRQNIIHIREALERYAERGIVLYSRVSSYEQAGRGKGKLHAKTAAFRKEVEQVAPGRTVLGVFDGVELGQLWGCPRKTLVGAGAFAVLHDGILVAPDLSRFGRPLAYSRTNNRDATMGPADLARLRELTQGVVLATLEDPLLSEDARHSLATRRTGKAGRPVVIDNKVAIQIFEAVEDIYIDESGRARWGASLREVANRFHVDYTTIGRLLDKLSPWGQTWRSLFWESHEEYPAGVVLRTRKMLEELDPGVAARGAARREEMKRYFARRERREVTSDD
jgi:hypothetical protein